MSVYDEPEPVDPTEDLAEAETVQLADTIRLFQVTLMDGEIVRVPAHWHDTDESGHLRFLVKQLNGIARIQTVFNASQWAELWEVLTPDANVRGSRRIN